MRCASLLLATLLSVVSSFSGTPAVAVGSPGAEPPATRGSLTVLFEDDLESGGAAFYEWVLHWVTFFAPWELVDNDSHSPTHAWFSNAVPDELDVVVRIDQSFLVPAGCTRLLFWHRYNQEADLGMGVGYDGGVLEVSTDDRVTWNDILDGNPDRFLANGYVEEISTQWSSPLAGRPAWTDQSLGWIQTIVNLSDFVGQTIDLRWRAGYDSSVEALGWGIDDVRIDHGGECNPGIFADGFESGDVLLWSSAAP